MERKGFTLAEVLITLGIIGVVAALTLPVLIGSYKKNTTLTTLKKDYSVFAQAFKAAELHKGDIKDWEYYSTIWYRRKPDDLLNNYLKPYLNIVKTYDVVEGAGPLKMCDYSVKYKKNSNLIDFEMGGNDKYIPFILDNGSCVVLAQSQSDTDPSRTNRFYIDVNGKSNPNLLGKDIFVFYVDITNGSFLPYGINDYDRIGPGCSIGETQEYCAAKILRDGWEIKDDYPW